MFEVTTAVKKMLAMEARKKVIQGATSSGKTYGIIPILYDKCLETPMLKITIVAESIPAVKDGAVDIFQRFMMEEGRWKDDCWRGNPMSYTLYNGSKIQFKSFDSVGKAKAAGKRDVLFLNEANHIPKDIADALIIRSKEIWMDFNADRRFWAHDEILTEPSSEFLKLTYLDNEAIPPETLEDLMIRKSRAEKEEENGYKGYWYNWWQVYGLGEIGKLEGAVYENWEIIDELPTDAKILGGGIDFGWINPAAAIAVYQWNESYILKQIHYGSKHGNNKMAQDIKDANLELETWYCDNASPQLIDDLVNLGIHAIPCDGKTGLVNFAIEKMNETKFYVTRDSEETIEELYNYQWDKDKQGNPTGKPIKKQDHAMNAAQYFIGTHGKFDGSYR